MENSTATTVFMGKDPSKSAKCATSIWLKMGEKPNVNIVTISIISTVCLLIKIHAKGVGE